MLNRLKPYYRWFITGFIVIAVIITSMLLFTIGEIREESQREQLSSEMNVLATEIYYQIFKTPQSFVSELSKTSQVKDILIQTKNSVNYSSALNTVETTKLLTNASIVYVMDSIGNVIVSSRFTNHDQLVTSLEGNNYRFRPYFTSAIQGKAFVYPAIGVTTGERGFYCSSPVYGTDSTVVGVTVIKMGFGYIEDNFARIPHGIIMLSPDKVVFATNYKPWLFNSTKTMVITDSSLQYNKTPISVFPFDINKDKLISKNIKYLVIKNNVGDSNWQIISICPKDRFFPIQEYLIKLTLIFLISVLILFTIILVLIINIRLRHNAQKALKINEEDLETTLNSIADAVIATDLKGCITRMNPVAEQYSGYKILEARGAHISNIILLENAENHQSVQIPIESIIAEKKQQKLENNIVMISKNGSRIQVTENSTPILSDNHITGIVIVIRDITHESKLQQKIRESELSLRKIIDNIPHYIYVTDIDGNYLLTNSFFSALLNKPAEKLEKHNMMQNHIIQGDDLIKSFTNSRKVIEQRIPIMDHEMAFINLNNECRYVTISKIPITYNSIPAALSVGIDITEIKSFQNELKEHLIQLSRAKEKAEESNQLKTAFLQNLSHQIRTPLNSIVGFIDLLATAQLTDEEKSHFNDLVKESSHNLLNTIQNIVDISKLETKQVEINKTSFPLNKLLLELLESFGNKNCAEVVIIVEPGLINGEDQVVFDREKLFSCLYRIVGNSVKYTSKGSIIFGYAIAGSRIDFWIKDTGKGIPKELTHQLFDLFQNASLPATFQPHGIGLGLAIVKQYVELLNGHIWFETEQNKGTSFYISFPYIKN